MYRARLCAQGFSQIPGVDFTENFAPVVNDITYRIVLVRKIIEELESRIIDVETAFLYGDLEEEIYMKIPEGYAECGYEVEPDDCLLLLKAIYGLVQAARQWWKKFVTTLVKYGFGLSKADACFLYRKTDEGVCLMSTYVDDNFIVGTTKALDRVERELRKKFVVKIETDANDYLGCEFIMSKDKKKAWLGQPHIVKSLEKKFGEMVKNIRSTTTPGTPGFIAIKTDFGLLKPEEQTLYRSGVGMLLYLLKHSRPDLSNCTRELSKMMDGANEAQWKELLRIIAFVLKTQSLGLKMIPEIRKGDLWFLQGFCDSDFASDKEKRISVTGYVIYFMGVPIAWRSRAQKHVTLSTSEAEYVALSEVVKDIKFIIQLLESMDVKVNYPIIVRVDNVGAIYLANNKTTGDRTKHVDIRYHFVRDYIEEGIVKIIFVKSAENDADIFTKNLSGEAHNTHSNKLVIRREEIEHG